jgi:hypothetical protein
MLRAGVCIHHQREGLTECRENECAGCRGTHQIRCTQGLKAPASSRGVPAPEATPAKIARVRIHRRLTVYRSTFLSEPHSRNQGRGRVRSVCGEERVHLRRRVGGHVGVRVDSAQDGRVVMLVCRGHTASQVRVAAIGCVATVGCVSTVVRRAVGASKRRLDSPS